MTSQTLTAGNYIDRSGRTYEISKVSTWNGHRSGYLTMNNPKTGHGWGGEISEMSWLVDVSEFGIEAR